MNKSYLNVLKDAHDPSIKQELISELMSKIPVKDGSISSAHLDVEILRASIIAEYDAINLYEQFADAAKNPKLKKLMLDIAKEEKEHVGELEYLLKQLDKEHKGSAQKGEDEAEELL